ncbi:MAG: hypothetical protein ABJK28_13395 [Algibacter sp.]
MNRKGLLKWNTNQLESIKRDLLFFDEFYYDPYLLKLQTKLLENTSKVLNHSFKIVDEIYTNVEFLDSKNILKKVELNDFKKGIHKFKKLNNTEEKNILVTVNNYDFVHSSFLNKYNETLSLLKTDYSTGLLQFINLLDDFNEFSDHHVRLISLFLKNSKSKIETIPLVEDLKEINETKKTQVIRLTIKNLPIPSDDVPLDEILDFRKDSDNKRRYLGLINWINNVSSKTLNLSEIEDELKFYTLEFENRMKIEKQKYKLSNVELIFSLPLEITENIIKINWSKIPKTLINIKKES